MFRHVSSRAFGTALGKGIYKIGHDSSYGVYFENRTCSIPVSQRNLGTVFHVRVVVLGPRVSSPERYVRYLSL